MRPPSGIRLSASLNQEKGRFDVDVEHAVKNRFRGFLDRSAQTNSRVVDENVDGRRTPEFLGAVIKFREQCIDRLQRAVEIRLDGEGRSPSAAIEARVVFISLSFVA